MFNYSLLDPSLAASFFSYFLLQKIRISNPNLANLLEVLISGCMYLLSVTSPLNVYFAHWVPL